jgi:hypothetical protein
LIPNPKEIVNAIRSKDVKNNRTTTTFSFLFLEIIVNKVPTTRTTSKEIIKGIK